MSVKDKKKFLPDFVEEVKERSDIIEIISSYVELKKQGKEFIGCCPFHNESSPSFSVTWLTGEERPEYLANWLGDRLDLDSAIKLAKKGES